MTAVPSLTLRVLEAAIDGELALPIAPGTLAKDCDAAVRQVLEPELAKASENLGAVLAATPERYARPLPGKDSEGRTRYAIGGRVEGGRLVPSSASSKGYHRR